MIQNLSERLVQNMVVRRNQTLGVLAGLFAAIVIGWIIVSAVLSIGFFGLFIAAPLVIWGATRLPQLAWFWGVTPKPTGSQSGPSRQATMATEPVEEDVSVDLNDDDLEHVPIPDPATIIHGAPLRQATMATEGFHPVRQTPVGTFIVSHTPDKAVLKVKSAIQYWCWAAPAIWSVLAFVVFMPVGSVMGASIAPWQSTITYGTVGGLIALGGGLVIAIISYSTTRPWVQITITASSVRYGDYIFDRNFVSGVRMGYQGDNIDLVGKPAEGRWGVNVIRLSYGRWGEDLKYMVSSRYVEEIAVWVNEIIDSVGAPPPSRYDPYGGRKTELL